MTQQIKLGNKVKCKVTGLEGIATARVEYINGCIQYCVTPSLKKGDNKYPDSIYLDQKQLEYSGPGVVIDTTDNHRPGGPQTNCPSN